MRNEAFAEIAKLGVMCCCIVAIMVTVTLLAEGCATLGIGDQPKEQAVLEAAALLMVFEYQTIKNDESLSSADIARALLKVGDEAVQAQGYASFTALVQSRIDAVSDGKFHPNVYMIYMLTVKVLEDQE